MYTFRKEERLCSKKLLQRLFNNGSSFLVHPFRIVFLPEDEISQPAQVVIAVSKKNFKRAVDRNLIKRRIKEAYRLHKDEHLYNFLVQNQSRIIFSIHYIAKELPDYTLIDKKMRQALKKLVDAQAAAPTV